jgi:hypothetical protein
MAPAGRRSRVEPRTRGGGDVLGHALDIALRQLADGAGADEPRAAAAVKGLLTAAADSRRLASSSRFAGLLNESWS